MTPTDHFTYPEPQHAADEPGEAHIRAATHEPGEAHRYEIACVVCGQHGMVRLTIVPERAEPEPALPRPPAGLYDPDDLS